ncbi:MAG: TIGR03619 family F420-dependent LLM class oxidoreductase [Acidimicrobiia bacterium]|nr:TIGR03619 family F420-dependent LLM class oxidoreductase [Acidimicrobiia bacterium]
MKLGFVLPNNWGLPDPAPLIDLAVEAEERGIDSVWVNHHVVNVGYIEERLDTRPYYDALTVLTWAAARTERVKLGTSVLVLPYLHPIVLAKTLATLDQLSGGRVIAGVGVGSLPEENAVLTVGYGDRGPSSDEAIEVMRALWSSPVADHDGERFSFAALKTGPQPVQSPLPLWVGGSGGPAQRRAARVGQGWHPMCSAAGLARRMPGFREILDALGRTRDSIVIAPRISTGQIPDPGAVEAFREAGADELIVGTTSDDLAEIRQGLALVAANVDR